MAQGKVKKSDVSVKDPFGYISESAEKAENNVEALKLTLVATKEMAKEVKKSLAANTPNTTKGIKDQNKLFERSNAIAEAKLKVDKRLKEEKIRLQELTRRENKEIRENIKNNLKLGDATEQLQRRVNKAQRQFKNLAIEQGVNSRAARRAKQRFDELDLKLRQVNNAAKDGRRDVGRYTLALGKLGSFIKTGLGFAGLTAGVYGFFKAIGDTFKRIREFDKEMTNMAALVGKSRKELSDIEDEILKVAGSSIRTSNEVAKLATTLFTLGKTKREVKLLLKPVNDLSVALGATSEETADFLGQTLNAFGKGAESGQEFADIIANIRSSTSLDFERIKDALGFVAPTAKALGISIGRTGAIIGVLQDNGIKAARAGRLMNTSFARLVTQGKTLDEALKEINEASDRVAKSTELFGAESFSLGLILADNIDKTAKLADEFDNLSDGSLAKLTNIQLGSLDSKIKILDSTWEKFILRIENGTGSISKFVRRSISGITSIVETLDRANMTSRERVTNAMSGVVKQTIESAEKQSNIYIKNFRKQQEEELKIFEKALKDKKISQETFEKRKIASAKKIAEVESNALKDIAKIEIERLKRFRERALEENKFKDITIKNAQTIAVENEKRFADPIISLGLLGSGGVVTKQLRDRKRLEAETIVAFNEKIKALENLTGKEIDLSNEIDEQTNIVEGNTKAKKDNKKETRELTGLIEKQEKVVSDLNEEIRRSQSEKDILSLSIDLDKQKDELDRLKRIANSSIEEINKIELDLIDDQTDKRIAKEEDKSRRLIEQIETNSRIEEDKKRELIFKEEKRLNDFRTNEEIKRVENEIDTEAKIRKAKFEQRRKGYNSEKEFEKEKAKEFEAIERNRLQARLDLLMFFGREEDKAEIEQLKADLEKLGVFGEKELFNYEAIEKALEFTEALIEEHYDRRLKLIQREEQAHRDNLNEFKRAAREGNITAQESLAEESRLAEEAKAEANRIEKEKQQILMVTSILKAFNSELAAGKNTGEALISAITSTTALQQFAKALPTFIDGTENVAKSLGAPQLSGEDGYIIRVDGRERIVDPENNIKMGNYTNDEVANIMEQYRLGTLVTNDTGVPIFVNDNSNLEKKLDSIEKAIVNRPVSNTEFGEITQGVSQILHTKRTGNRVVTNRFIVRNGN